MGSPTAPSDAQYVKLVKAGHLAEFGQPESVSVNERGATVKLNLPRQAVALLVVDWK